MAITRNHLVAIQDRLVDPDYEGDLRDVCFNLIDELHIALTEIEKLKEADDGRENG